MRCATYQALQALSARVRAHAADRRRGRALNIEEKKIQLSYKVGDNVKICSGLFEGYTGVVQSISDDLKTVTVLVKRGRRDMPVELDTSAVKADIN